MTLRARALAVVVANASVVASGCARDDTRPPFANGDCVDPPCSTPTVRGSSGADAGRGADAGPDAADARD
ncbi:MAG TPA: hypothetical protein VHC69_24735 [Polyangiaceae bacterium]|nr:hypothetical protein [Polyangiaceae bacterium]